MVDFTNKTFKDTYRDFYDANDGYYRVLYNSGKALQARELNESQTMIQEEIARFGRNIFKEGALVNPGGSTVDNKIEYIRLADNSIVDPSLVGESLTNGTIHFTVIEYTESVINSDPLLSHPATLFVQYTDTSAVTVTTEAPRVKSGETLTRPDGTTLEVRNDSTESISASGRSTKAYFAAGDFFVQGHFVYMEGGSSFIDKYSDKPTKDIGFRIDQKVITESEDIDLYDNQGEVPDVTAPGAHRYQIKLVPTTRDQVSDDDNFVFIARVVDGIITREVSTFDSYNRINDLLAQRTKEESGDYVVEDFKAIFEEGSVESNLKLDVTEGIAYVDGYRLEIGTTDIDVPKARDTIQKTNEPVPALYGNYVYIDPVNTEGFGRLQSFGGAVLKDSSDNDIGYCNIRGIQQDSVGYRLYIFNIRMNTGESFSNVIELEDNVPSGTPPRIKLVNSLIHEATNNNLLFSLPRTSPKNDPITANYTVQRYIRTQADNNGEITISGVEMTSWVISEDAGPILTQNPNSSGTYTGLSPNNYYTIAYYVELSNVQPRTKQIASGLVEQTIPTVDWQIRPVKLGVVDGVEIQSVKFRDSSSTAWENAEDITYQFYMDGGQRDNFYDQAIVYVKPGYVIQHGAQAEIQVEFTYYDRPAGGVFFCASSYSSDTYDNIPYYTTATGQSISLRDVLDFRPDRALFSYLGEFDVQAELPQNASAVTINSIQYYLPRIDVLVANSIDSRGDIGFGELQVIRGESSVNPREPEIPTGSLALYKFRLNAYTFGTSDLTSTFIPNRRFTMKDIGKLEKRVNDLYELTTLSLLEVNTNALTVLDADGNARTKAGFIADNFSSFTFSDINNSNYRASIDPQGLLKPSFRENSIRLMYSSDNVTAVEKHGDLVTLPYTHESLMSQLLATGTLNVNPFAVITQTGHLELSPSSDEWVETRSLPPIMQTTVRRFENFEADADLWNVSGQSNARNSNDFTNTGLFSTTNNEISFRETTRSVQDFIGEQVANVEIIPFMRSRRIRFTAKGLRPNTKVFAFFAGEDMSSWVREETSESRFSDNPVEMGSAYANATEYPAEFGGPSELQTDANGELIGSFFLPNTQSINFRTGTHEFKLLDVSVNNEDESTLTSRANYTSTGSVENIQRTIRTTRIVGSRAGRTDPLAQTFFIDQIENPNGIFITKAKIFMESKDTSVPLQVQIRSVENGVPTSRILPGAVKFIDPSIITATPYSTVDNEDGMQTLIDTGATEVEFDEPIYLTSGEEYAIVLLAESVNYNAYIAETYDFIVGSREDKVSRQPTLGSLFLSQNGFTWTPDQTKDLMFSIDRAKFSSTGDLVLDNTTLPKVTLNADPIETTQGSSLVKIYHEGHGFSSGDIVELSGIVNPIGGFSETLFNTTLTVVNPQWDGYTINMGSSATSSSVGGGSEITATQQVYYDEFVPQIQSLTPNRTGITAKLFNTTASSYGGSRSSTGFNYGLPSTSKSVFLNEYNKNTEPSVVASENNANGSKTMKFSITLSTEDDKVSPVIDLQRVSALALENVIDNNDAAQHITVPIVIDESSVGLKIIFAANRPDPADFEVYVKTAVDEDALVATDDTDDNNIITDWVLATIDSELPSDDNASTFRDYEYTVDADQFTAFQVKIVMHSNNSSKSPVIRDLRAIALVTGGGSGGSSTSSSNSSSGSSSSGDSGDSSGGDSGDSSGGDSGDSSGSGSDYSNTAPAAFSDISSVPSSITITGSPRTLAPYNPESDINNYNTPSKYWHQETRRIRLFTRFQPNGDFQVVTNDSRAGSINVGADILSNMTTLFTGKWLDRSVQSGETFECGMRITEVDGQSIAFVSNPTNDSPHPDLQNAGNGADLGAHPEQSVTVDSTTNWAPHGFNIVEHSNALDNGQPYYVDTLHLDPNTPITGTFRVELFVQGNVTGTTTVPFDVSYTLQGAPEVDDSLTAPLVLVGAEDGFVGDPDAVLEYYSLNISKPREFHDGSTVADQILTVDANSTVDFHMYWGSDINSTIDITFGAGWNESGQTVTLNRGDFQTFNVGDVADATDLSVTATTTLGGQTFTRQINITASSTTDSGGGTPGGGDPSEDPPNEN